MLEAEKLLSWAERHTLSIKADHISGLTNVRADWLSRENLDPEEWRLHSLIFLEITQIFGHPLVDLFATVQNTQLPRFYSRFPNAGAEGCDALRCLWPPAFPPLPLIPKVIRKLLKERVEILLVAPLWLRRAWYADLVSLSISQPWTIPQHKIALSQGVIAHPEH